MLSFIIPKVSYQRNEEENTISILSVQKVLTDTDKKFVIERIYDNYTLIYAHSGNFRCFINNEKTTLKDGELVCISKYTKLALFPDCEKNGVFYIIEFNLNDISFISFKSGFAQSRISTSLRDRIPEIYGEYKKTPLGKLISEAHLLAILLTLSRVSETSSLERSIYEKAMRYIIDNAHLDIKARDVAEATSYNKDYLCRLFTRYGQKTLKATIAEERMNQAKILLSSTRYPLTKISALLSFSDSNAFVKFFKYHTSITPTEYRRMKSNL